MAGPLTKSERQQRTANLVNVANLAMNYRSLQKFDGIKLVIQQGQQHTQETNKHLQKTNVILEKTHAVNSERLRLARLDEKRKAEESRDKKLEKLKKEQQKMQRDALFHLNKELEELTNSSQSNLEKYFLIHGINSSLKKNNIKTSLVENFDEKKLIDDCLSSVEKLITQTTDNLTEQDTSDIKTISDIMLVNEKEEIQLLKLASKKFRKIDKELQVLKKESNLSSIVKKYSKIVKKVK
tara:strand:+ start:446 stop:1162 length:717 start_codon:yes stop_codon:yes gene_type:complete